MMHVLIAPVFEKALISIHAHNIVPLVFEIPKTIEHGHLSTNIAMTLARHLKRKPADIAQDIINALVFEDDIVESVQIAGAGFINIYAKPALFHHVIESIRLKGNDYGKTEYGKGKSANVEYVSANPTGKLHLGHGRNAAIGDTIANLLEWAGYKVTREYYFNNAGNQMNMLAKSIFARYRQLCGTPEYPFPEDGYHGDYIKDIAQKAIDLYGSEYTDPSDEILSSFRKIGEEWCFSSILNTLKNMKIHQDTYFNEDSLYHDGTIDNLLNELKTKGLSYQKDGATWFNSSRIDESLTDRVIVKQTGEPTYRLPDIAYHRNKFERNYDIIVDIFGADHIATIPDVTAALKALDYDIKKLKVLIYQFVTLWENGEQVKMSKRSGKSYTLDELIDEVGPDIVRFFFIMRGAQTQLEFDLNIAREQNDKNPVYYLQYVHARICSMISNAADKELIPNLDAPLRFLTAPAELTLITALSRFEECTLKAAHAMEPQIIAEYLRETASAFHSFYHDCRIIGEEHNISQARINLALITKTVIHNGLAILGISSPEKM
jgi:arginyl-tRNA synthetase